MNDSVANDDANAMPGDETAAQSSAADAATAADALPAGESSGMNPHAGRVGLIAIFCNHPVAANLLMAMMLLAGVWGLKQLNTQFFPSFNIDYAIVITAWSGASAADVEELITTPMEAELRDVDFVKEMVSVSEAGASVVTLEFEENTDMGRALDQVKERAALVRGLPDEAETPEVRTIVNYEQITNLLVVGGDLDELRALANQFESELLARGIAKVNIGGLPSQQIAIEVPTRQLQRLNLSLDEIGRRVEAASLDAPLGIVGRAENARQLRFRERRTTAMAFESVPIVAEAGGRLLTLGDIANIERKAKEGQHTIQYRGRPAVELALQRTQSGDSLQAANIFREWLEDVRPRLPAGVEIIPFSQQWELLSDRIGLLVRNGLGGLALVIVILFLFMNGRVAWWTAVGIPVSFMAALAVFYLLDGSINMISLFGLIMALGIIVDDTIVVGEEAMSRYQHGTRPRIASELAAKQMLWPVLSSSLTTIAAFMPLLVVGGIIGAIMQAIPMVVICVIIASLLECFLILPGHLTHSFRKMGAYQPGRARRFLDAKFESFRDRRFRPLVTFAVRNRWTTLASSLACLIAAVGLLVGGRLNFDFFPTAEADRIFANVGFVSGTPAATVKDYLREVEEALYEVEEEFGEEVVRLVITRHGKMEGGGGEDDDDEAAASGDHVGGVRAELLDPDQRGIRNRDIIEAWRAKLPPRPGVETLSIVEPRAGPPGADIDVRFTGDDIAQVKRAALALQDVLRGIAGVSGIGDNTPYGREQMVLQLTPTAEALGLTVAGVARQLRAAFDGYTVQELSDGYDDLEVRVLLPPEERNELANLAALSVVLPGGAVAPLGNLADIRAERGFDAIRHSAGKLAITVTAGVDPAAANANRITADLETEVLPRLADEHRVQYSFEGRQADQEETLDDMLLGLFLALALIYLVLSWVFGSYGWPLLVMFVIPFGLTGAIVGHYLMGQDLTILSLFGFFALSGIVVNDSIILVVKYKRLREDGMAAADAVVEAACMRLRAVLLTSLTTIAGLSPLLFETSLQAQFLIPMATTIAFGLAFATLLVLLVIPALLLLYENARVPFMRRRPIPVAVAVNRPANPHDTMT